MTIKEEVLEKLSNAQNAVGWLKTGKD